MSTYQELRGLKVKYLAADPDPGTAGEVWYNTTTFQLKGFVGRAAWSAGATMIAGVGAQAGNSGIQTAAFYAGGTPGVKTQEYNGTGWSLGGDINTTRYRLTGAGTQTAGLVFGGQNPGNTAMQTATEEYNGSTWTSNPSGLDTGRAPIGSAGTQTAGLAFGGRTAFSPPYGDTAETEEYNGSAWTAGGDMPAVKIQQAGAGLQTAALAIGGQTTTTTTYEYDGSSWSEGGALNTGRSQAGAAGTQTAGLVFGGGTANTEDYDGTSWTETSNLGTSRETGGFGPMGTNTAALLAGSPGASVLTEEFHNTFEVVTQGAWGSGGNINTTRRSFVGGAGTLTAGMIAGGYIGPFSNATEEYDGSAWTNGGNYPASLYYVSIGGTQTAGVGVGGGDPIVSEGCEYNGTAWSDITNAPASRKAMGRAGTQTAGLFAGGNNGDNSGQSEAFTYDGSSFSNITDMPDNRGQGCINGGAQTAAVMASGLGGSAPQTLTTTTDEWDGSSWGAGGTCLQSSQASGNANSPSGSDHLTFGGYSGSRITSCFNYDGTSWFTSPALPTATEQMGGFGIPTAAVSAGGSTGSAVNATVEFAGATTAETASTIDFD